MNKDTIESKYSMSPERLKGEVFEDYKERQKFVNIAIKEHLRGKLFHPSIIVRRDEKGNPIKDFKGNFIWIGNTYKKEVDA